MECPRTTLYARFKYATNSCIQVLIWYTNMWYTSVIMDTPTHHKSFSCTPQNVLQQYFLEPGKSVDFFFYRKTY